MSSNPPPIAAPVRQRGFTIVELMVVVVVVAILSAIAYPSFADAMRKGRRSEAMSALASVQQAQERWRANHPAYADSTALTTAPPDGLGQRSTSDSGYYSIAIAGAPDATSYVITATVIAGTKQAGDSNCLLMGIQAQGGRIRYGSGNSTPDWDDPNKCWAR
jgi:type IV pilus assembly protein PilE